LRLHWWSVWEFRRGNFSKNGKLARKQSSPSGGRKRRLPKASKVAQFLKDMLKGVGPRVARGQDTRLLQGILDETAQRLDRELQDQPEVEADLREALGNACVDIGDYSRALAMNQRAHLMALRS
jgi:hypothetical protein